MGLVLIRQVLYYLSHTLSPFWFHYFSGSILPFFVRASDCDSSTCASHTAGMTGVYHHAHLLC
jgi:hypothetical protein